MYENEKDRREFEEEIRTIIARRIKNINSFLQRMHNIAINDYQFTPTDLLKAYIWDIEQMRKVATCRKEEFDDTFRALSELTRMMIEEMARIGSEQQRK